MQPADFCKTSWYNQGGSQSVTRTPCRKYPVSDLSNYQIIFTATELLLASKKCKTGGWSFNELFPFFPAIVPIPF